MKDEEGWEFYLKIVAFVAVAAGAGVFLGLPVWTFYWQLVSKYWGF